MEKLVLLAFLTLLLYTYADIPKPGLVNEFIFVENKLPWNDARTYCKNNYSTELFTVTDANNLTDLTGSATQLSWIGLYRWTSAWRWVDTAGANYFNWYRRWNCTAINRYGVWLDQPCYTLNPYVCQYDPMKWYFNATQKTWLNAKQACESDQYNFAVIHNYLENINISAAVTQNDFAWVGLSRMYNTSIGSWRWIWVDNALITYSNWFTSLFCAVMDQRGFWYDRLCFEENPFVCFKTAQGIRNYMLINESKSFTEAQNYCEMLSMNLVTVKTEKENTDLLNYVSENSEFFVDYLYFWIGLYNDPWHWINGSSNVQNWNSNQPDNYDFQNKPIQHKVISCVASKDGEWFDENCFSRLPFFCSTTVRSIILVSEPKSWEDALDHCRDRYVDLVSLVSDTEQQVAVRKIQGVPNGYVWTGLRFLAGSWFWVYGDSLQYENWLDDGQMQCPGNIRCGALAVASGKWEARSCEEKLNFLCFKK